MGKSVRDSEPETLRGIAVDPGVGAAVAGLGVGSALTLSGEVLLAVSGSAAGRSDVHPVNAITVPAAVTTARWLQVATVTGTG